MRMMQVSAFLENRPGRLLRLLGILAEAKVNLLAHEIVDASDFGIAHLVADDPKRAVQVIEAAGITCSTTTVLVVDVPNQPGAFVQNVLKPLAEAGVNIQYSYAFSGFAVSEPCPQPDIAVSRVVLKVDGVEKAERALAAATQAPNP
ncbi:MAG: amino acid-binding protein [Anaerolineae bacterium]